MAEIESKEGVDDDITRIVYAYDSDSSLRQSRAPTLPMVDGRPIYDIVGNPPWEG